MNMFLRKSKNNSDIILLTPKYKDHLYDITSLVELFIEKSKLKNGFVNIHVKSCTAAIMIQENGDNSAKKDILKFLNQLTTSENWGLDKNNKNSKAYLKASLIGPSKIVPVIDKKLVLSFSQKIFFCEFDGPDLQREIILSAFLN